jgi:hypothetical protein
MDVDPYFHPIINSWISENAFSVKKRSIQVATYSVVVQWGAIVGSQIFRADDAPWYFRGYKVLIAICCLSLVLFVVNWWYLGHLVSVMILLKAVADLFRTHRRSASGLPCRMRRSSRTKRMSPRARRTGTGVWTSVSVVNLCGDLS